MSRCLLKKSKFLYLGAKAAGLQRFVDAPCRVSDEWNEAEYSSCEQRYHKREKDDGVTASFSVVLSARGLWSLRRDQSR